jgi:hypothetical protein
VGGAEDPDVDDSGAGSADRADLVLGEESEQHGLRLWHEVPDLIQETVPPWAAVDGARERAPLVAKELAPQELSRQAVALPFFDVRSSAPERYARGCGQDGPQRSR